MGFTIKFINETCIATEMIASSKLVECAMVLFAWPIQFDFAIQHGLYRRIIVTVKKHMNTVICWKYNGDLTDTSWRFNGISWENRQNGWMDRQIDGEIDRSVDISIDRSIDRQIDKQIDRQIDRQCMYTHTQIYIYIYKNA